MHSFLRPESGWRRHVPLRTRRQAARDRCSGSGSRTSHPERVIVARPPDGIRWAGPQTLAARTPSVGLMTVAVLLHAQPSYGSYAIDGAVVASTHRHVFRTTHFEP